MVLFLSSKHNFYMPSFLRLLLYGCVFFLWSCSHYIYCIVYCYSALVGVQSIVMCISLPLCVCPSVSLWAYLPKYSSSLYLIFCACYVWPYGRGSVLLWQHCNTLCRPTSGVWMASYLHTLVSNITHTFNDHFARTTRVSRCQKGKTNLDFTVARHGKWHQLGHMQVYTLLQADNHVSTPPLSFFYRPDTKRLILKLTQQGAARIWHCGVWCLRLACCCRYRFHTRTRCRCWWRPVRRASRHCSAFCAGHRFSHAVGSWPHGLREIRPPKPTDRCRIWETKTCTFRAHTQESSGIFCDASHA